MMDENLKSEILTIRPAARLISTIGEDLIGDAYAAMVELVKNSYDADASRVDIIFNYITLDGQDVLKIEISDDGHGMSKSVVRNAWLVPATKDKVDRTHSPKGRQFQGKKGIGRYSAAILGQELVLKTIDQQNEKTEVYINWSHFDKAKYLEDVQIILTTQKTSESSGTALYITATGSKYDQWGRGELYSLSNELRKLKSPFKNHGTDDFSINLAFINCPFEEYNNQVFEIEAFPIIELFDYRISGTINEFGALNAKYENKSEPNLPAIEVHEQIHLESELMYCGPIDFDFRVFDRDSESISNLIDKGLIDPISKLAVGKRDAKRMLDQVYGVNLYREGFRIRPYGNGGIDWLDLDKDRIQNPSLRISNNQIVGFVNIKPELLSNLEEKSARDGLKHNKAFFGLKTQLKKALNQLEEKRFAYRLQTGKGRHSKNINNEISNLFNYDILSNEIRNKLSHLKINDNIIEDVASIIYKDAERKSKLLENIQNTIAIYQGQATLGKIVSILLHEGRKPVQYFKQQSPNMSRWLEHYKAKRNWEDELYEEILDRLKSFKQQSEFLAELFRRLDPLAKQNKGPKESFSIRSAINKAARIFEGEFQKYNILYEQDCNDELSIIGWEEDLIIALANLIENSVYWLQQQKEKIKLIQINVTNDDDIVLHYKDTGPGIEKHNIESGVIFEPGFSKKIGGTGLGLAIAGEAIERLNGSIVAHHSNSGAYFTIELKK